MLFTVRRYVFLYGLPVFGSAREMNLVCHSSTSAGDMSLSALSPKYGRILSRMMYSFVRHVLRFRRGSMSDLYTSQ